MNEIPIYQIDAFTDKVFGGNPAAVCPLNAFLSDNLLQSIAAENNLAETAYLVPHEGDEADYHLRWFTPAVEVALCGHATLASAVVVLKYLAPDLEIVRFSTLSGILTVQVRDGKFELNFPALPTAAVDTPAGLGAAMGAEPVYTYKGDEADRDLLLVYDSAETIAGLNPDSASLRAFAPYGFIATAAGDNGEDFVSRCFFPNHGIDEDAVTGSAHCVSAPYWAERLGKTELFARQISERGGDLWLKVLGDGRVAMSGYGVEVMRGTLFL